MSNLKAHGSVISLFENHMGYLGLSDKWAQYENKCMGTQVIQNIYT